MILCNISDSLRYSTISPSLDKAMDWLRNFNADEFVKGTIELDEAAQGCGSIIVKCEEPALRPAEKAELEAHRRYIDIQVPLKGTEKMGWKATQACKHPRTDYDADADIRFFGDAADTILNVKVGQMVIFFPEDAHAPNIGLGNHRKLCIKVPV